jgi:hypothetical protein
MLPTITTPRRLWLLAFGILTTLSVGNRPVHSQSTPPREGSPYIVEWVYKIKPGYADEWNRIFWKYQITGLNRQKEAGTVTKYIVQRPAHHAAMADRWDLRVIIYYKNQPGDRPGRGPGEAAGPGRGGRGLSPADQETRRKEENRRWELTLDHWDREIREVDPNLTPVE